MVIVESVQCNTLTILLICMISSDETPEKPEIHVKTAKQMIESSVEDIIKTII